MPLQLLTRAQAEARFTAQTIRVRQDPKRPILTVLLALLLTGFTLLGSISGGQENSGAARIHFSLLVLTGVFISLSLLRLYGYRKSKPQTNWQIAISAQHIWLDLLPLRAQGEESLVLELGGNDIYARSPASRIRLGATLGLTEINWRSPWLEIWLNEISLHDLRQIVYGVKETYNGQSPVYIYDIQPQGGLRIYWQYSTIRLRPHLSKIDQTELSVTKPPQVNYVSVPINRDTLKGAANLRLETAEQVKSKINQMIFQVGFTKDRIYSFFAKLSILTVMSSIGLYYLYLSFLAESIQQHDIRFGLMLLAILLLYMGLSGLLINLRRLRHLKTNMSWVLGCTKDEIYLNLRNIAHPKARKLPTERFIRFNLSDISQFNLIKVYPLQKSPSMPIPLSFIGFQFIYPPRQEIVAAIKQELADMREQVGLLGSALGGSGMQIVPYANGFAIMWQPLHFGKSYADLLRFLSGASLVHSNVSIYPIEFFWDNQRDEFLCPSYS
jgi:hypothetical protein